MSSRFISVSRIDAVQIFRLNRPERLGALSREMIGDLSSLFINANSQPDVLAIILTGTGHKAFCAGIDTTETGDDPVVASSERVQELCKQIENCSVPVIAAVNGLANGGGCELALACHIRVASDHAEFSFAETKLDDCRQLLGRELADESELEIIMSGKTISAEDALRFGLVSEVVPGAELISRAEGLAHEITQLAPLAIRACLKAVAQGAHSSLAEGLALESKLFAELFATEDVREGTDAFLEKRAPIFQGK